MHARNNCLILTQFLKFILLIRVKFIYLLEMAIKNKTWQSWKAKLKNVYRFQIVEENSYDVKFVTEINRLNVIIAAGLILAFFTLLNFLLIAFTPLKQYIPGYGATDRKSVVQLSIKTKEMEQKVNAQQKYIINLQNILNDNIVRDEVKKEINIKNVDKGILSVKSPDEERFVKEVEKGLKNAELMQYVQNSKSSVLENLSLTRPVAGKIISKYSEESPSITFKANENDSVRALLSGSVIYAENSSTNEAIIAIQANNQLVYVLKNNTKVLKKSGNFVREGEPIAIAGKSNTNFISTLMLWYRGQAIDATEFFNN